MSNDMVTRSFVSKIPEIVDAYARQIEDKAGERVPWESIVQHHEQKDGMVVVFSGGYYAYGVRRDSGAYQFWGFPIPEDMLYGAGLISKAAHNAYLAELEDHRARREWDQKVRQYKKLAVELGIEVNDE